MIPKIIHYCWFGRGNKPKEIQNYINTWKRKMSDYQIIEWNEDNFDIDKSILYVQQAYKVKKWAFVSDYVRLKALYEYGGIYLDTDVEIFKNFNDLLENECFFGFEANDYVMTAVMGTEPKNSLIKEFIDFYEKKSFIRKDGSLATNVTNVMILTELLEKKGITLNGQTQVIDGITVYSQNYFASNDFKNIFGMYRKDIYSYHHCVASWYKKNIKNRKIDIFKHYLVGKARNYIGTNTLISIKKSFKIFINKIR